MTNTELTVIIKVYKENKFWIVEVPELQLVTQGETLEKALRNAKEMVEGYLEAFPDEIEKLLPQYYLLSTITIRI